MSTFAPFEIPRTARLGTKKVIEELGRTGQALAALAGDAETEEEFAQAFFALADLLKVLNTVISYDKEMAELIIPRPSEPKAWDFELAIGLQKLSRRFRDDFWVDPYRYARYEEAKKLWAFLED
ncbi:hypothetical protein D6833_06675 [Candidatus Parcubacteria bacterium]|nr:MAG: hypothetical protein D6833_06675 [Candidatus Parcubacteria bacterium]